MFWHEVKALITHPFITTTGMRAARQATALIPRHLKKETPQSVAGRYSIVFHYDGKPGYQREGSEMLFWESRAGFMLCYRSPWRPWRRPVAFIDYDVGGRTLLVRQIQGVKGKQDVLSLLHWERLLFATSVEYGKVLDVDEVCSLPALLCWHYPKPESMDKLECQARAQRMHVLYDKTPKRCDFAWCDARKRFVYRIAPVTAHDLRAV